MQPGGEGWGEDILSDTVLCPFASEGAAQHFAVYTGRVGPAEPFSFVPACPRRHNCRCLLARCSRRWATWQGS